jgi:hypothetical protein
VPKLGADALLPHPLLDQGLALLNHVGLLLALPPRRLVLALQWTGARGRVGAKASATRL